MKFTKGSLLGEETLKIVIAALCIAFLFYFLARVYSSFQDTDEERAKATLKRFSEAFSSKATSFVAYSPSGWSFFSSSELLSDFPDNCRKEGWKNCICLQKNRFIFTDGLVCEKVEQAVVFDSSFTIKNPVTFSITETGDSFHVSAEK